MAPDEKTEKGLCKLLKQGWDIGINTLNSNLNT